MRGLGKASDHVGLPFVTRDVLWRALWRAFWACQKPIHVCERVCVAAYLERSNLCREGGREGGRERERARGRDGGRKGVRRALSHAMCCACVPACDVRVCLRAMCCGACVPLPHNPPPHHTLRAMCCACVPAYLGLHFVEKRCGVRVGLVVCVYVCVCVWQRTLGCTLRSTLWRSVVECLLGL